MRKRTAAAGTGAVGLAAFGLWMFDGFGEFGLPTAGEGGGAALTLDPTADGADVEPAPTFAPAADRTDIDPADPGAVGGPADADGAGLAMVDVLVDGGEYYVVRRFASDGLPVRDPMTLEETVGLARSVPGAADGVRVRVSRKPNAIAGAVTDLMDRLREAGFEDDQIDYRTRLVEDPADGDLSDPPVGELPG